MHMYTGKLRGGGIAEISLSNSKAVCTRLNVTWKTIQKIFENNGGRKRRPLLFLSVQHTDEEEEEGGENLLSCLFVQCAVVKHAITNPRYDDEKLNKSFFL